MIEQLIFLILVLALVGVLLWVVQRWVPMPAAYKQIMTAVVIIIVILWLLWWVSGRMPLP